MSLYNAHSRRSASALPFLPTGPGVNPDASKGAVWRSQAAWGYLSLPGAGGGIAQVQVYVPGASQAATYTR